MTAAAPEQGTMAAPALTLTVYGEPAGQGRISFVGRGKAKHSNEDKLKPWRAEIIKAALAATSRHQYLDTPLVPDACAVCRVPKKQHALLAGVPVAADITITVPRPRTVRRPQPITRSSTDIDHHARAVLDSLSAAGIVHDDAQVTELTIRKAYPGGHPAALDRPGATIHIWALPEAVAA